MRLQKKIIKASAIAGIVFIIAYAFFIVKDNNSNVMEFYKNISVGIIGSLFVSLLIGFVTYSFEKSKDLGNYITAYQDLFNHCSKYSRNETSPVKLEWFNDYVKLFHQLDNAWGSIDYIFDKYKCKDYLTGVRNYYFDFIALTQDYFSAFDDEYDDYCKCQYKNVGKVENKNVVFPSTPP